MARLSIAIIARNEEARIGKCLESVRGANEIVLLDTGSTDKTVSIACTFPGVKLRYHTWDDERPDFSEARNHALSYCTSPWVLSIDADECLVTGINSIYTAMDQFHSQDVIGVLIKNNKVQSFFGPRLFRRHCTWRGRIHEQLDHPCKVLSDGVTLFHDPSPNHEPDPERNIRILRQVIRENPTSSMDIFYLGEELYRAEQYDASQYWLAYYVEITPQTKYYTSEAFYMLGECFCKLHRTRLAIDSFLSALRVNPEMKIVYRRLFQLTKEKRWEENYKKATNKDVLIVRE